MIQTQRPGLSVSLGASGKSRSIEIWSQFVGVSCALELSTRRMSML